MERRIIDELEKCIRHGWLVFPVNPVNKAPFTKHGFKDASDDMNQIATWIDQFPDCGWGIPTSSNSFIIDVDSKNGGIQNWQKLLKENTQEDFETVIVKTQNGGFHYYFKAPVNVVITNIRGNLPDGIDVRGEGGYVVIPPTEGYEYIKDYENTDIILAPDWLIEFITTKRKKSAETFVKFTEIINDGERNETLFRKIACSLRARGLSEEAIISAMQIENKKRCNPPVDLEEIKRIAKSASKYEQGEIQPEMEYTPWSLEMIMNTGLPEPIWAIPNMLPTGLTILAGKPKVGKSWLALQIAQAVSTGGEIFGMKVEQRKVLYIALEDGVRRLKTRTGLQNWVTPNENIEFLTIGEFHTQIGDLKSGGQEVLADIIRKRGYGVIIIDTLSRAFSGDQNKVDDMTLALEPAQVVAHKYNCALVVVDHHKKGTLETPDAISDILGSTAKGAMADSIWGLYKDRAKGTAILNIIGRDFEEQSLAMRFESGKWYSDGTYSEVKTTEKENAIIEFLNDVGQANLKTVTSFLNENKGSTYRRLKNLVNKEVLAIDNSGKTALYYIAPSGDYSPMQERVDKLFSGELLGEVVY